MPLESIVKPWVRTALYGARPRVPQLSSKRRLEPAAMLVRPFDIEVRRPALFRPMPALEREDVGAAAVEPDVEDVGDHLVIVGVAVRRGKRPRWPHPTRRRPARRSPGRCGAFTCSSTSSSPVFRSTKSAIGTPQARWRLITQSGRCSTIEPSRLRPFSGTKRVSAIACRASWRSVGPRPVRGRGIGARRRPPSPSRFARPSAWLARARQVRQRLVHGDEPLRGAAVDDLGLRPPRMRVAVPEVRARREQRRPPRAGPSRSARRAR